MTTHESRPRTWWRRLLRFSIRGLLVVMVLVAIPLAWWVNSAYRQRQAIAMIERHGMVAYKLGPNDPEVSAGGPSGGRIRWPWWLVRALGADYFSDVDQVVLLGGSVEAELVAVSNSLPAVSQIVLGGTRPTRTGLEALSRLTELRSLTIDHSTLDSEALKGLGGLTRLDILRVYASVLPDDRLDFLRGLKSLSILQLDKSSITDRAFPEPLHLAKLRRLGLRDTKVGDASTPSFSSLPMLSRLDLEGTQVTDIGLAPFQYSKQRIIIFIDNTKTTGSGLAKLRRANPNLSLIK